MNRPVIALVVAGSLVAAACSDPPTAGDADGGAPAGNGGAEAALPPTATSRLSTPR
jgi:hypothetical protein